MLLRLPIASSVERSASRRHGHGHEHSKDEEELRNPVLIAGADRLQPASARRRRSNNSSRSWPCRCLWCQMQLQSGHELPGHGLLPTPIAITEAVPQKSTTDTRSRRRCGCCRRTRHCRSSLICAILDALLSLAIADTKARMLRQLLLFLLEMPGMCPTRTGHFDTAHVSSSWLPPQAPSGAAHQHQQLQRRCTAGSRASSDIGDLLESASTDPNRI